MPLPLLAPRSRRRRRLGALAVVVAVAGFGGLPAVGQEPPAPEASPGDEPLIGQLEEITSLEQAALDELARIDTQIVELDATIVAVEAQVTDAQTRVGDAEAALAAAGVAEEAARQTVADEQARLVGRVVSLYVAGPGATDPSQFALAAGTPTEALTMRTYGEAVVASTQELIEEFEAAEAAAAAATVAADGARAAVVSERDSLQGQLGLLGTARDEATLVRTRQEEVARQLEEQRADLEAQILAQDAEADAIGALLAARQAAVDLALPPVWIWPVPSAPRIGSPFGNRLHPVLGYVRLHRGSDIGCATGADILATAPGEVIIAGVRGGYGNTVVIDHGGKVATLMAHNSALLVAVGDLVAAGQVVARCGSTGLSTGPHSHFEIRLAGNPVDPAELLTPPG